MYNQPQASMHPSLVNQVKYHTIFMGSYLSATLLSLSLISNMTSQSSHTGAGGTESFQDAEVFAKAYQAFDEGKGVQADWSTAAKTNNYVFFTLAGINYAYPAFVNVPNSVMPVKSAKILLGYDDTTFNHGWLQETRVLEASRNAAFVQHGANLILGDFNAPPALQNVAQRALNFAAKVRNIPGFDTSIEGVVVGRAGLTYV